MLFKDIPGQFEIKNHLIQTIQKKRVSHAQLFYGQEGTQKLALAIAYAQYLNCENKKEDDSCGVCGSCIKYQKLVHPDLHFYYPISPKKAHEKPISKDYIANWRSFLIENDYNVNLYDWYESIGIETKQGIINAADCNDIIQTLSLKSYESEYKVVIIWMVEKLFHSAAPKLLKVLEEPPENTVFLLVSENHDQILNTILSRTQLVKIPRIQDKYLLEALMNQYGVSEITARRALLHGNGNYYEIVKYTTENEQNEITFELFLKWLRVSFSGNTSKIISVLQEISSMNREKLKYFLNYAQKFFRNCLLQNTGNVKLINMTETEFESMQKISVYVTPKTFTSLNTELEKAIFQIGRNAYIPILMLDLSFIVHKLLKIESVK